MRDLPLTRGAKALVDEILFRIPVKEEDALEDDWSSVTYYYLGCSKRTMTAINVLMDQGALYPAEILLRHLFELAVTLRYLDEHPEDRPDFVNYYSGPLPKKAWRPMAVMCEGLGLREFYDSMYRLLSEKAHGGVGTMGREYRLLRGHEELGDHELAHILLSAMSFYSWTLAVGRKVFPYLGARFRFAGWARRVETLYATVTEAFHAQQFARAPNGS